MKRKISIVFIFGTFLIFSLIAISCEKKNQETKSKANNHEEFMPMVSVSKLTIATLSEYANCCDPHGGSVGMGRQWFIATCKSKCTSGIGFNCGGTMFLKCADGFRCDVRIIPPNCPPDTTSPPEIATNSHQISQINDRLMRAECIFYTNNTMKLVFLNRLPASEDLIKNMEVEEEILNPFPSSILIDRKKYTGFTPQIGSYPINRKDGKFGSVTITIKLI